MSERPRLTWSGFREADDEPVDVSRYMATLKRTWPLIALIVVLMTLTVLVLSLILPKTYEATAQILMDDRSGAFEPRDVETLRRRLATVQALLGTRDVLRQAAARLPDETVETLEDKVESSVDADANIVDVTAVDGDPDGAAAIANGVARSFLTRQATAERDRVARARADLQAALDRLGGSPANAGQAQALRERLSELSVSEASAGTELRLAQAALPPREPNSPRLVRNTIFALFASAFIGVLAALAIGQLAPRLTGPRELSRLTGVPILAALPPPRRRRARRAQTEEAYQALQASLLKLPATRKVVLVTSAFASEEKSTVAVRLAESLAGAGSRTLLVSADLRRPRIEGLLGLSQTPGLTDLVRAVGEQGGEVDELLDETLDRISAPPEAPDLHVLPSGSLVSNPAQLLAGEPMAVLFRALERSDYRYVLVDGPPLLGVIDGPLLAQYSEAVLVVCRLDRMTPGAAAQLGDVLEQLHVSSLGLVAIGVRDAVAYPLGFTRRIPEDSRSAVEA